MCEDTDHVAHVPEGVLNAYTFPFSRRKYLTDAGQSHRIAWMNKYRDDYFDVSQDMGLLETNTNHYCNFNEQIAHHAL